MFWKNKFRVLAVILCVLALTGCEKQHKKHTTVRETTTEETMESRKEAVDTVVVTHIDAEKMQITVKSISGALYILNYTSGSRVQNRYGTELLMQDVTPGEIAQITYLSGSQKLLTLKESEDAWENTSVSKWEIDYDRLQMQIGSDRYSIGETVSVISQDRLIDIHQLNAVDTLVVKGIGNTVYSIFVKQGHGYIKITGQEDLVGGLIEVGNKIMTVITEEMILVAPEGDYILTATKDKIGGSKEITVSRDCETFVSLSEFKAEVQREGTVRFRILPDGITAHLFVDSKPVSDLENVVLSYGKHTLTVTSDGYADYQESLIINSVYMNKTIDLSAQSDAETEASETTTASKQEETTTGETSTEETSDVHKREDGVETITGEGYNNQIVVSGPVGAEIYLDGISCGMAPLTIQKTSGEHIFVVRKDGYKTTAYTYQFDTGAQDIYLKFPEPETSDTK